jgi:hypothetical protein
MTIAPNTCKDVVVVVDEEGEEGDEELAVGFINARERCSMRRIVDVDASSASRRMVAMLCKLFLMWRIVCY